MASLLNMSGGSLLGKGLPYDAEIEWLYMPYGSYIDTGVTGLNLKNFDITCVAKKTDNYYHDGDTFFGVYAHLYPGIHAGGVIVRQYPQGVLNYNIANFHSSGDTKRNMTILSDFMTLRVTSTAAYCNGTMVGSTYNAYNTVMPDNPRITMYINCRKDYRYTDNGLVDDVSSPNDGLYKRFIYVNNGITVFDGYPVRVGNVGYLYDKVSGQLFGNAGTGSFILGPDVTN